MTLKQLSMMVSALIIALLLLSYGMIRSLLVVPYVERQVLAAQRHEVKQVLFQLESRLAQMSRLTQELALSDQLSDALSRGQAPPLLLTELPLVDGVYLFNSALELVSVQQRSEVVDSLLESQEAYRRARLMPLLHPQQIRGKHGVLRQGDALFLYSAVTVCRQQGDDCGFGYLLLAKRLETSLQAFLSQGSGLDISLRLATLADGDLPRLSEPEQLQHPRQQRALLLMDALDQPAAVLTLSHLAKPPGAIGQYEWLALLVIGVLGGLIYLLLWKVLVVPMTRGVATIRAMERHQQFRSVNSRAHLVEFHQLAKVFNGLMRMLTLQRDRMANLVRTDPLTGLANRRALESFMEQEWRRLCRYRRGMALLVLDIEQFHRFNETYGYGQGDQLLIKLSRMLRAVSRRGGELAARYGSDEFALVITEVDQQQLERLLRHIQDKLAAIPLLDGKEQGLRVNMGAALVPPGTAPDALELQLTDVMERAEGMLYQTKQTPSDHWQLWQPEGRHDPVI
ncbi:GGDEF domain-containing protein [Ferrimonas pelagia]|uniref:diguanylate cyclase n=1 Tax=Ferrimonas pelagia TaxID=1177826 RepID=A0ABP9FBV0_9GAMM